eukprot:Em0008g101a
MLFICGIKCCCKAESVNMDTATNSSGNCSMPFDSRGFTNVAILRAISGLLSAFCAFYSVLLIVAFKRYLLSFQRIALYFCISSLIKGLSDATNRVDYVFRNAATRNYCEWSGFYLQYALWTQFLSILCFVSCTMSKVVFQKEHSALLCWIRDINEADCTASAFGIWLQYVLWTVPQAVLIVASTIVYFAGSAVLISRRRKWTPADHANQTETQRGDKKEIVILLLFPIIFVVLNIPSFAIAVLQTLYVTSSDDPLLPVWYLYGLFTPLAPALCLLYTTNFQCVGCSSVAKRMCTGICVRRKTAIHNYTIKTAVDDDDDLVDTDHRGPYSLLKN